MSKRDIPRGAVELPHDPVATAQRAMALAGRYQRERDDARARRDELEGLVRRASSFVNAVAVMAEDKTPALEWVADAAKALPRSLGGKGVPTDDASTKRRSSYRSPVIDDSDAR